MAGIPCSSMGSSASVRLPPARASMVCLSESSSSRSATTGCVVPRCSASRLWRRERIASRTSEREPASMASPHSVSNVIDRLARLAEPW